ncbi:MAG TPA: 16S rRNA (cytosine(967)-C(5))-methyltransferase RsmB [Moraxellaceae bacterium]
MKNSNTRQVRALAAMALTPVLAGKESLSDTLPPALAKVAPADRGLLQALAFTTCRHALHYRQLLKPLLQKAPTPVAEALLLVGLAQLRDLRIPDHAALSETVNAARELGQDRITGLINAVLRRYLREKDALEENAAASAHAHPEWLRVMLERDWGVEKTAALFAANNQEGPLTLRVNARQQTRAQYLEALQAEGIKAQPCAYSDVGLRVEEGVSDVRLLPGFNDGAVSVQDESAQLAAAILDCQPGMRVLDACAAPGGKTAHILERTADLQLQALDIAPERCARIEENLQRLQLPAARLAAADAAQPASWWSGENFDRILLDAPCTATGVIRRHPDIKLLRRPSDVAQTMRQQAALLAALWPLLKPGGRLLYATCSVLREENEKQIATFLAATPDAREEVISASWGEARPHGRQIFTGSGDGFFYALLARQN